MTTQQAANLRSARALAISRAGLKISVDQANSLPHDDRVKYLRELASVILSYPARFDEKTVESARIAQANNHAPLEKYTFADAVVDFVGEAAAQAQAINPLSEQNRGKTSWFLYVVTSIAAVVFFGVLAVRHSPARK